MRGGRHSKNKGGSGMRKIRYGLYGAIIGDVVGSKGSFPVDAAFWM